MDAERTVVHCPIAAPIVPINRTLCTPPTPMLLKIPHPVEPESTGSGRYSVRELVDARDDEPAQREQQQHDVEHKRDHRDSGEPAAHAAAEEQQKK